MTDIAENLRRDKLLAAREAYERTIQSPLERRLFEEIGPRARARGHLVKTDLDDLARWRARRASGFVARCDPDEVVEISSLAFAPTASDRVRLKLLTLLDGISERAAATALAVWDPDRFVPWDERAAALLVHAGRLPDATLPASWSSYVEAVHTLAAETALSGRDVEKALYALAVPPEERPPPQDGTREPQPARGPVGPPPELRGDPNDDAGRELMRQVRAHGELTRDIDAVIERAERSLRMTTPEQRKLLLRIHRTLASCGMYTKTSRDLGWNYYANDIGKGLIGEVALRVPRGIREIRLVAYIPVEVSAGANGRFFETSSQTQQKGQIPTTELDEADLIRAFKDAQRWAFMRS